MSLDATDKNNSSPLSNVSATTFRNTGLNPGRSILLRSPPITPVPQRRHHIAVLAAPVRQAPPPQLGATALHLGGRPRAPRAPPWRPPCVVVDAVVPSAAAAKPNDEAAWYYCGVESPPCRRQSTQPPMPLPPSCCLLGVRRCLRWRPRLAGGRRWRRPVVDVEGGEHGGVANATTATAPAAGGGGGGSTPRTHIGSGGSRHSPESRGSGEEDGGGVAGRQPPVGVGLRDVGFGLAAITLSSCRRRMSICFRVILACPEIRVIILLSLMALRVWFYVYSGCSMYACLYAPGWR